jgi:O-antigen ligase
MLLLKVLIIALLLFFPFGEIIRIDLGNNIFLKPVDAISILIFVWTSVMYIRSEEYRKSLQWYFFLFPAIGLISLLINTFWLKPNEFLSSLLYLVRWVAYLSVFFAVIKFDNGFIKIFKSFLIADGVIVLFIGFLQFFFYPSLRDLFYQGWDEHLYRMFSSFLDPNFVGAFFVLYLIFIAGFLFANLKNRKAITFYSLLLVVTLVAIFLTYSRSALIMLVVSGITFFILKQKKKFILLLLGILTLFIVVLSPFFYIENLDLFRFNSSLSRLSDIGNAITIFKDHPLIGVGFNSYRYAQIHYHFVNPNSLFPSHSAAGTDNSFVFILATTGVIGLITYFYLWYQLLKKAKLTKNKYPVVFISSVIGIFVNSLFNNSLFYPEIMLWMWMIAGLSFSKE